jgi:hypothetical protein
MKSKIIILIILYFIFKNITKENYEDMNFFHFFLVIEDKIRVDLTTPKIHYLSLERSKFLFNYIFNLKYLNLVLSNNLTEYKLGNYLDEVCFIKDYNLSESIIFKLNSLILNYLGSNIRVDIMTSLNGYYLLLLNLHKLKFKESFIKNIDYKGSLNTNSIILDLIIDIIFDNDNFSDKSIKDEIINILVEKKWIILETVEDYDDLDLLLETLNETYKSYINVNFNLRYDYLLNFSISEIQNLYYGGDTFDFVLNLDLFCK